ncbi:hypothetical protein RirG_167170 [Rhizophagus irregularis DAOM 197198w]|uniref:C2H2-type domain-containing protein n=1 Tax=Rhizophagus irregularis (strain DAOM 197198w) TaxID=1432141 RepID=A0A015J547_RHIIW|nr:hypothetical protein RirG_167170 [Rhizophagus irregularis DAOM 197198w]
MFYAIVMDQKPFCCGPSRAKEATDFLLNNGFLPPITKAKDEHFTNPIHLLEYYDLLKIPGYDSHCSSLDQTTYSCLRCSVCNKYFPTLAYLTKHKKAMHTASWGRPKRKSKNNSNSLDDSSLLTSQQNEMCYDFNEYAEINFLNNNLECLRYWPSDIKIDNAISIGYERAIHLAKYLEMTAIPDDAYYFNIHKRFPDLQLDDFWNDDPNPRIMDSNDEFNVDNLSTNQYINHTISKMNINREKEINSNDSQITFLMKKNYNWGPAQQKPGLG